MRRILALAAVSGLALTGLIGTPAAADNTIQDVADVVINEVAVDLTDTTTDINYVELSNTTMTTGLDIDGWQIKACAANGSTIGTTVIQSPAPTSIDDLRLAGDNNYNSVGTFPTRDYALAGPNGDGLDADGGVALVDDGGTPIHAVTFDATNTDVEDCLLDGGGTVIETSPSPTTSQTAQRFISGGIPSWSLATRTPGAAN